VVEALCGHLIRARVPVPVPVSVRRSSLSFLLVWPCRGHFLFASPPSAASMNAILAAADRRE
jgi:hypothetical protein